MGWPRTGRGAGLGLPSHHEANALGVCCVERRRIRLGPASICRLERIPGKENLTVSVAVLIASFRRDSIGKLGLPTDAALLSAIISPSGDDVLQRDEIALAVMACGCVGFAATACFDGQEKAVVCGQIPVLYAGAVLRGKAGAAQRRCVEMSVEAG